MIISMTGFGRGEAADNGTSATVELKTLNSRYLDLTVRLPQKFQDKELAIKELVQQKLSRGKINVSVHISDVNEHGLSLTVDPEKVKAYASLLNSIREMAGIEEPLDLRNITSFSEIFISKEEDEASLQKKWTLIEQATSSAIDRLLDMRVQEGNQLQNDLKSRIENIETNLKDVESVSSGRVEEVRNKYRERIQQLITDENYDKERLETEIAILADKMDITEEVVRLKAHLKFFIEAIDSEEPAGRRLNFLTQEINRELNTIGSKANDSTIAHHIVRSKETLEQIREQVQNVE